MWPAEGSSSGRCPRSTQRRRQSDPPSRASSIGRHGFSGSSNSERSRHLRAARPFAPNPHELGPQIEDQVIALDRVRRPHTDAELCSLTCDRKLGDSTLLICSKHVVETSNGLGWAMSCLDTLRCNNIARTLERCQRAARLSRLHCFCSCLRSSRHTPPPPK